MGNVLLIYVVIYMVLGLIIYHSIFEIWYFNFGKAILGELVGAFLFALLMTALTMKFWWIALIIIILIGLGLSVKVNNPLGKKIVIGVFVVVAVITAIIGIRYNKMEEEQKEEEAKAEEEARLESTKVDPGIHLKTWNLWDGGDTNKYYVDNLTGSDCYINTGGDEIVVLGVTYESELYDDETNSEYGNIHAHYIYLHDGYIINAGDDFYNNSNHPLLYQCGGLFSISAELEVIDESNFTISGYETEDDKKYNGKYRLATKEDLSIFNNLAKDEYNGLYYIPSMRKDVGSDDDFLEETSNYSYEEEYTDNYYEDDSLDDVLSSNYIINGSDEYIITESDLYGLSAQELTYARNEIYARHGYVFKSEELNNYFQSKPWYVVDESYDGSLTDMERTNANFISEYQKNNGLEYKPQ